MSGSEAFSNELKVAAEDSIENIERGVRDFVCSGQAAAYRNVAVELAKLLLEPKGNESLFGRAFGKLNQIYVQSMKGATGATLQKRSSDGSWRDTGPPLFPNAAEILRLASGRDQRISLDKWLKEKSVRDKDGSLRNTESVLMLIRNTEGAHSDRRRPSKDWRSSEANVAFTDRHPGTLTVEEIAALRYDTNWQQFIIHMGASLLYSCKGKADQLTPLFPAVQARLSFANSL